jgi:kynurenine formamidase
LLDGQAGTHVVLPSYSLPPVGFDNSRYSDDVRVLLKKFESQFGPRGNSSLTLDQAPLGQMLGPAHVIDVRKLIGSTQPAAWPASPAITLDWIKQHETQRPIQAGEVVIFFSGYSDEHFQPLPAAPELDRLFAAPLAGKAEGWLAPTPEVIAYLAERGIRCIGTDGPTLGGVNRENALFVNWLAANKGVLAIEYLTNVGSIQGRDAFFVFAPIKIKGTRGGYGRALALY